MNKIPVFAMFAALSLTAPGCTSPSLVDPVGTWSLTDTWTTGTCGATGSAPQTLHVSRAGAGDFQVTDTDATVTAAIGTSSCDEVRCQVSLTELASESGVTASRTLALTLDDLDGITGSGLVSARNTSTGATCSMAFTVAGRLAP